jgi:hypothetical protein
MPDDDFNVACTFAIDYDWPEFDCGGIGFHVPIKTFFVIAHFHA